ncbi:MAG TPA: DUF1326 domain-containing protein [Pyrinomonadaceae bacterium]|nr:DUF1326 domain-containing protein [Pyrinomonadaceae bacterium]
MAYQLEGRLLEVCTCNVLCPCWVGEDPDNGTCDGTLAWHVDKGQVNGTDVSGHTIVILCHIPGNILKGNWSVRVYVDDGATPEQKEALLNVWTGKLGGPVADLAQLVGEVVAIEQVPITFQVEGVNGTLKVGSAIDAGLAPFKGATGKETAIHDTIFTTIPGSPAYVGKASHYTVNAPAFSINLQGYNAVSGSFRFEG